MAVYLCPLFGFDVVGYSLRTNAGQQEIQSCVHELLDKSLRELRGDILESHWLDAGDGGYVVVQGHIKAAVLLLEQFVDRLHVKNDHAAGRGAVRDSESGPRRAYPIEARYALHFGTVLQREERIGSAAAGDGVNDLARLLAKMPQDRPGQVVVSDAYRRLLVEEAEMSETLFQKMPDLIDKHCKTHGVWNFHKGAVGVGI
jgi:hypothetical protein